MFREFPGTHSWEYWRKHLADSLTFVGEQFRSAQIAHAADNVVLQKYKNTLNDKDKS